MERRNQAAASETTDQSISTMAASEEVKTDDNLKEIDFQR